MNDEETGRYIERGEARRLQRGIQRSAEHAQHARILADLAHETGGNIADERELHRKRRQHLTASDPSCTITTAEAKASE